MTVDHNTECKELTPTCQSCNHKRHSRPGNLAYRCEVKGCECLCDCEKVNKPVEENHVGRGDSLS